MQSALAPRWAKFGLINLSVSKRVDCMNLWLYENSLLCMAMFGSVKIPLQAPSTEPETRQWKTHAGA